MPSPAAVKVTLEPRRPVCQRLFGLLYPLEGAARRVGAPHALDQRLIHIQGGLDARLDVFGRGFVNAPAAGEEVDVVGFGRRGEAQPRDCLAHRYEARQSVGVSGSRLRLGDGVIGFE